MEINGQTVSGTGRYDQMNLSPELMRAIEKKGYVEATSIQAGAIPHFMDWKDVIAKAPHRHRQNLRLRHPYGGAH